MLSAILGVLKRAVSFIGFSGAGSLAPVAGIAIGVIMPLFLWDCSRSRLEDLRLEYSALETEYAALSARLADCREASGLQDAVLATREREIRAVNNKYNGLREELLRAALLQEEKNAQTRPDEVFETGEAPSPDESFQDWCAQPLPGLLRGLLTGSDSAKSLP